MWRRAAAAAILAALLSPIGVRAGAPSARMRVEQENASRRPSGLRDRPQPADDRDTGIRWEADLPSAVRRARAEDKPIFIAFSVNNQGDPESPYY